MFGVVDNLRARLELVEAVLRANGLDARAKEFRDSLAPKVRARSRERASVAHALWRITDALPDDVLLETSSGYARYDARDFDDIARRCGETAGELMEFRGQCLSDLAQRPRREPSSDAIPPLLPFA
jgi:hypothetical protein